MTERTFRIFLGTGLLLLLYMTATNDYTNLLYYYVGLLAFEGITNWRMPKIISMMRQHSKADSTGALKVAEGESISGKIPFEAERAMRLVIALILLSPLFIGTEELWVVPWFVASMLLLAGVTNICPMVMFFRWLGFR